eukprot:1139895-Pelagomonas_calceolata.AAC.2
MAGPSEQVMLPGWGATHATVRASPSLGTSSRHIKWPPAPMRRLTMASEAEAWHFRSCMMPFTAAELDNS